MNKSTSSRPPKIVNLLKSEDSSTATDDPGNISGGHNKSNDQLNRLQSATSTTSSAATFTKKKVWTNEEIEMIINLVHLRPFLYDKRHEDYKQTQKKVAAWIEIATVLNTTGTRICT